MTPDAAVALDGRPSRGAAGARLGELFTAHGRMVYGVCRLLLRDPVEAEDAAQQTFLSAHRSMLAGTEPRDAAAWLATIARNECRGRIRERMREPLGLPEDILATADGPEEVSARRTEIEALRTAIRELPDKQREAVVLRDLYGLRYGEVGAALGVSLPAVEALLFRARRSLQARLRPVAAGLVVVPLSLRESLAQAIPGFATGSAASGGGAVAVAGVLAKLGAAPLAAKVAAVSVAVTAAGTAVAVESRSDRQPVSARAAPPARAAADPVSSAASPPPGVGLGSTSVVFVHHLREAEREGAEGNRRRDGGGAREGERRWEGPGTGRGEEGEASATSLGDREERETGRDGEHAEKASGGERGEKASGGERGEKASGGERGESSLDDEQVEKPSGAERGGEQAREPKGGERGHTREGPSASESGEGEHLEPELGAASGEPAASGEREGQGVAGSDSGGGPSSEGGSESGSGPQGDSHSESGGSDPESDSGSESSGSGSSVDSSSGHDEGPK